MEYHKKAPDRMSDTEQRQETERVSMAQWPEDGEEWSDAENDGDMDCELLQAITEEDEGINVYNEETFGMDLDPNDTTDSLDNDGNLSFGEPLPQTPPPDPKNLSPDAPSYPSMEKLQFLPRGAPWQRGRGLRRRGGMGRGLMFEDPAVMRIVEGRPSLMSLDSAIVDCGHAVYRNTFDRMSPIYRKRAPGTILQDSAIVCVIGHRGRGQHSNSGFVDLPNPISYGGRRGVPRGSFSRRYFGPTGVSQVPPPMMGGSPIFSRQPLTPPQQFSQMGRFMFPPNRCCPSSLEPATPKMMQPRFGENSPRLSQFYSPPSVPVQPFSRHPGPVTQLHPQHTRLLSKKQHLFQRKPEGWDPYCNLMTSKEKEWIIRLQMIQLQSENPYLEDYYYQEFYRRLEAKMAEEELGIRSKKEPPKLTTPYITKTDAYTPVVHIEGSLGQVAVSTCYSPRRAISAVHAVQAHSPLEEQKDTRQQRLEILSKIEKLFVVLLEVEEGERMKSLMAEGDEHGLMEKTQRKVEHIYLQLKHHHFRDSGGEFSPYLNIPKGKRLLARLLPFLKSELALKILHIVASNLPTLINRDTEEALPVLYAPLRNVIGGLTFSQLIEVLKDLTSSESLTTYECLSLACQNKFGLSLLYALLSHGEKLLSSGVPLEPSIGDFETWTDVIFQVAGQLTQCLLVEPILLPSNLLTLFCRYLDKRTVHQLKSNMESATGSLALPS